MTPILVLNFTPAVVAKLGSKHGVTVDEVRESCHFPTKMTWTVDPERGRRLLVRGTTDQGRRLKIWLYPTDNHGEFNVASAYNE